MLIREYRPEDCRMLAELFYRTVHQVNARDYTQAQLEAWAPGDVSWKGSSSGKNAPVPQTETENFDICIFRLPAQTIVEKCEGMKIDAETAVVMPAGRRRTAAGPGRKDFPAGQWSGGDSVGEPVRGPHL